MIGTETVVSSQGVRQGDPLGPLLFSLAIRPLLTELITSLGPDQLVLAYLDDVYILSTNQTTMEDVTSFFAGRQSTIKLNPAKCKTVSLSEVRENGLEMLGTCVGSREAREIFLKAKADRQVAKLDNLHELPHQHALLLLRQCLQQDLRHLQRSLKVDDIADAWGILDDRLRLEVRWLRGNRDEDGESEKDGRLIPLPVRLGGVGVLSYVDCAAHAYAAASQAADTTMDAIINRANGEREEAKSQRERCQAMFEQQRDSLVEGLGNAERMVLVE